MRRSPLTSRAVLTVAVALAVTGVGAGAGVLGGRRLLLRQAALARAAIGKPLGEQGYPVDRVYQRSRGNPITLLLVGDSIAAGLGADRRRRSLGVQLAKRLALASDRAVRLVCAAEVGAETWQLVAQVDGLSADVHPDVTVVVVGGNDVIHRLKLSDSVAHLESTITTLRAGGSRVVVGTCPDLGALTAVPQPLRGLGRQASRRLAAAQRNAAVRSGAYAVSLADALGPVFRSRAEEMFAVDRFHPSGAGYRRAAKALLPSVLASLDLLEVLPPGHHGPSRRLQAV